MMHAVTNREQLRDGMSLIAENHNLKQQLEDANRMLEAYEEKWLVESRAKRAAMERMERENEERRARELREALEHKEYLLHNRDYSSGYLKKIYGREARPGQRHLWNYYA